ncbi:hypothetical protein RGQ29_021865 [Quercus rubra]|uniref:Uncharacterized protein n=1 Tax=Quercus rubra TaxID=3512 RepID=A0AAN7IJI2_QUERU|nr:hypothetical protein RGQ29_021865 [Quercus rubra]
MEGKAAEDEEKWLAAGIAGLQQNAFYMHRALDSNNLRDALKYSAQMLSELRTSKLSPHKYYELYMRAFDELRKLEMFFKPSVDIKTVLSQLMERLSNYAASSTEVLPEFLQVEAFSKLSNAIGKVIEAQVDMPTVGVVTLYSSLLTFTLHVHPDRLDYADQVLVCFLFKLI